MSTNDYVTNDYSIEVNFLGSDLEPELVSQILNLSPVKAARRGAPRPNGNGSYEEGHWVYETSTQDDVTECRDHQLTCLIDTVEPHIEKLRAAGVERILFYYTLSSFIGLMNIRFKSETMARLGAIEADLYVTCFDCFNSKHPFWQMDTMDKGNASA